MRLALPLAASGQIVIGVVVIGALLLLLILLRSENDTEADREDGQQDPDAGR